MAYIPKGVLEKLRKICFKFLWFGKNDKKKFPLVKWRSITHPKDMGEWGLKNISIFLFSLAAKSLW